MPALILRETVENHNAEIIARNLREWFSTGFHTPVISTALPLLHPMLRHRLALAGSLYAFVARQFFCDRPFFRRNIA